MPTRPRASLAVGLAVGLVAGLGACAPLAIVTSESGFAVAAREADTAAELAALADASWAETVQLLDSGGAAQRLRIRHDPQALRSRHALAEGLSRGDEILVARVSDEILRHEFAHVIIRHEFAELPPVLAEGLAHWAGSGGCAEPWFAEAAPALLGLDVTVDDTSQLQTLHASSVWVGEQGTWSAEAARPVVTVESLFDPDAVGHPVPPEHRVVSTLLVAAVVEQRGVAELRSACRRAREEGRSTLSASELFGLLDLPATRESMASVIASRLPVGRVGERRVHGEP